MTINTEKIRAAVLSLLDALDKAEKDAAIKGIKLYEEAVRNFSKGV